MAAKKPAKNDISLEELLELRQQTERLSTFLREQLAGYMSTLRPLIAPRRVLGKYAGAVGSIAREDEAFAELREHYDQVCSKFRLRAGELEKEDLRGVDSDLELYPWEYTHDTSDGDKSYPVTVTSPVRWVLTFRSDYTLEHMRAVLNDKAERKTHAVQNFVVNALVINLVLQRNKGVGKILDDLRYELTTEFSGEFGKLPLTTLRAPFTSFRPSDKLVLSSTRFSGVPAFIELIDTESIDELQDPLREKLDEIKGS